VLLLLLPVPVVVGTRGTQPLLLTAVAAAALGLGTVTGHRCTARCSVLPFLQGNGGLKEPAVWDCLARVAHTPIDATVRAHLRRAVSGARRMRAACHHTSPWLAACVAQQRAALHDAHSPFSQSALVCQCHRSV